MLLARNLFLSRGSRCILNQVSVSICPAELVVILGPSGSGKSTLMKTLAGITGPDKGELTLDGRQLSQIPERELCRLIGMVPQDDIIHRRLSVSAALSYAAQLRFAPGTPKEEIEAAVERVLRLTELTERRDVKISRLSGGQRKRVNLGVELLDSPHYLFLDEPTSGLDPALEESMMRLFKQLAGEGHGVLTSTHSMASLDLADQLLVVMDGRLIFFGPPRLAATHFGVGHYSEIFKALKSRSAEDWFGRFKASPLYAKSTERRRMGRPGLVVPDLTALLKKPAVASPTVAPLGAKAPAGNSRDRAEDLLAEFRAELEAEEGA